MPQFSESFDKLPQTLRGSHIPHPAKISKISSLLRFPGYSGLDILRNNTSKPVSSPNYTAALALAASRLTAYGPSVGALATLCLLELRKGTLNPAAKTPSPFHDCAPHAPPALLATLLPPRFVRDQWDKRARAASQTIQSCSSVSRLKLLHHGYGDIWCIAEIWGWGCLGMHVRMDAIVIALRTVATSFLI